MFKKYNTLKISIIIFWTSVILFGIIFISLGFIKIDQVLILEGTFEKGDGATIIKFYTLEDELSDFKEGDLILMTRTDNGISYQGEIAEIKSIDSIKLSQGEINEYSIKIKSGIINDLNMSYYFNISLKYKSNLTEIILNKAISM